MKLLCDECIDGPIVEWLVEQGHEVYWVLKLRPSISDQEVAAWCREDELLLISNDQDFGKPVKLGDVTLPGVALLRLDALPPQAMYARFAELWPSFCDFIHGHIVLVAPGGFRQFEMMRDIPIKE